MSESTERSIRYLARSPLFSGVEEDVLRSADPPPEMISLQAGDTLIREGELSTDYFVLVSGRLRAFRESGGRLKPIGEILPGEGVGEMSLLTNEPRFATVMARMDCELVRFPQSTFLKFVEKQPMAVLDIARTVIKRLAGRGIEARRKSDHPTIAILPLTQNVDARALAHSLAAELETYGRARSVDSGSASDLDEIERKFDFVVYSAQAEASEWYRSCLLRADLVLLTVGTSGSPEPGQIERELLAATNPNILGRIDLLVLHPPQWRPRCGVAAWLERLKPREHHHVRCGNGTDIARLCRIITGRAINLVLSGGGARAFAQIGVGRALKEFGIPIDRVCGSSMGAGVAAVLAFDDGFEDMAGKMRELFLERRPRRDLTLPVLSLFTGKKLTDVGRNLCGEWAIEDLPIRYFCISSDLGKGEIVEHFAGPLWIALRATASMPAVAPPLFMDGRVLVDGGVLNNLPIDIMKRHFSGKVFAVDVSRHEPLSVDARWELMSPSGFQLLRDRMNPYGSRFKPPNILQMIRRTATLASDRQGRDVRESADLLFVPPVEAFNLMDFDAFDRIVEAGYRHARVTLEKWVNGEARH
jgi:NTE family protein